MSASDGRSSVVRHALRNPRLRQALLRPPDPAYAEQAPYDAVTPS